jgi:hypothetical protein
MIQKGSTVKWKWGNGFAKGDVVETFDEKVTRSIGGHEITRNGEPGDKALLIKQSDGQRVLKRESEVQKA